MKKLEAYRTEFDSLQHCRYLISNSLGAMPNKAHEAAAAYTASWAERGVRAWEDEWWMLSRTVGDQIGRLMNAPADSVSIQANVTSAEAAILSCFRFTGKRNKVVMVDMEFPSIKYLYHEWVKAEGGRIEMIACPDGVTIPTEQVCDAIDETTLLVPISHVLFRSSYIVDARAIVEKAHAVGAQVILDTYQSLGSVPVDVSALQADFAVGGCLKWLCGGPGVSFLYVRPDLCESLSPRFTGWLAHEQPFSFAAEPIRLTGGAYRFMNGTPVVPALYTCRPGLDIVSEIGPAQIRERSKEMTALLLDLAGQRGWPTTTPADPKQRAGTVAINIENGLAIATELNRRDFLVDYRPKAGIRLSPHFYTTDREIEETIGEIDAIRADKSYEKHLQGSRIVT
jgi:kynureninase